MRRLAAGVLAVALVSACAAGERRGGASVVRSDRAPRLEDAFDGAPDLLVVVRPARIVRDPLYGPLVRRVGALASARAGVGGAVGTTALAALERTDEVLLGVYDREARDAVIALRGVPADVEAARLLDTSGAPLWIHFRDFPTGVEELVPHDGSPEAALFVLPRRGWLVAVGQGVGRAVRAYGEGLRGEGVSLAVSDAPLALARLRGEALVHARPALAEGPLMDLVRDLDAITVSLEPGPEGEVGEVGEVAARLVYGDVPFAARAERCANDVLGAFTRKYDASAPWLRAVKVGREERTVVVKGRIPRAWVDGFVHVELDDLAK